uniref:Uncharacterized protein n=1 Tax=Romanomermis culicivorax TaxID=13658 RepID=A0A915KB32_ROMCU
MNYVESLGPSSKLFSNPNDHALSARSSSPSTYHKNFPWMTYEKINSKTFVEFSNPLSVKCAVIVRVGSIFGLKSDNTETEVAKPDSVNNH